MRNIFIGLLLSLIDINITSGNSIISLVPDFIGYGFVLKGMLEMAQINPAMLKRKTSAMVLIVASIVDYAVRALGFANGTASLGNGIIAVVSSTVVLIAYFYVLYYIIDGLKEIQVKLNWDMGADNLMVWWKINLIITAICFVMGNILSVIFALGGVIASILFIIQVYKSKKQWDLFFSRNVRLNNGGM